MKEWIEKYSTINFADLVSLAIAYAIKAVIAILLLIIGFWLIGRVVRIIDRLLEVKNFDVTFKRFIRNLLGICLKILLVISILNFAGFRTTSFIALLGAAGLAVGLALQGSLTNFAGGVLLIIFKPFKVGDLIEAQGKKGIVSEVQIFTTVIMTADNKMIFIPNHMLSNGVIENLTDMKAVASEEQLLKS
ncbi:MAG: mechanosensitive ion channel protein [Segetibacter sp.]|nr:mechanosensitive ion channel protein [Segetibacter sp.]